MARDLPHMVGGIPNIHTPWVMCYAIPYIIIFNIFFA